MRERHIMYSPEWEYLNVVLNVKRVINVLIDTGIWTQIYYYCIFEHGLQYL